VLGPARQLPQFPAGEAGADGTPGVVTTAGALCQAAGVQPAPTWSRPPRTCRPGQLVPVVVMDETGWRVGASRRAVERPTRDDALLGGRRRGFEEACEVITADYDGTIVRDGWAPYRRYKDATHQTVPPTCSVGPRIWNKTCQVATPMPKKAKAILKDALAARELAPEERAAAAVELAERLAELCQGRSSHEAVRRYLAHLAKEAPAMFSFLADDRSTPPTGGRTRHTPSSGEPQSLGGNRTAERPYAGTVMSVIRTATQHGVDAIDYLTSLARGPDPRTPSMKDSALSSDTCRGLANVTSTRCDSVLPPLY